MLQVILVGTDIPDVSAGVMAAALDQLSTHEVVLGPAVDGGFYLIGASRVPASLMKVCQPSIHQYMWIDQVYRMAAFDLISVCNALRLS